MLPQISHYDDHVVDFLRLLHVDHYILSHHKSHGKWHQRVNLPRVGGGGTSEPELSSPTSFRCPDWIKLDALTSLNAMVVISGPMEGKS